MHNFYTKIDKMRHAVVHCTNHKPLVDVDALINCVEYGCVWCGRGNSRALKHMKGCCSRIKLGKALFKHFLLESLKQDTFIN